MFEIIVFTLITIFLALYSQFLYSRRRIYEDDMIFCYFYPAFKQHGYVHKQGNKDNLSINSFSFFTCKLVILIKSLLEIKLK